MGKLDKLQPAAVWNIFEKMSDIPRGSGNETAVMNMFKAWADDLGLDWKDDEVGNLLVSIPGTKGLEKAAPILIQGHVDMVCEKNAATKHDFEKDPLKLQINGDWVTAEGTTLGADNGIGVAMGLALAEDKTVAHGPVEVLLTVDEERGLTGAAGVQAGFFKSRKMINLDSEEDQAIFIGCGLDIHKHRGNAIKILTRALLAASTEMEVRIVEINGGSMRNAIPREAEAKVVIPRDQGRKFKQTVDAYLKRIQTEELAGMDDGFAWKVAAVQAPRCFSLTSSTTTLGLLAAIPSGVTSMSRDIAGLVESSTNLGVVKTNGAKVNIVCCSRSSIMSALDELVVQHRTIGEMAGAEVEQPEGYPGWKPNMKSAILAVTRAKYKQAFGVDAELLAIHAGLECGLLTEKYPSLDIVSFGPNITGAHSPDEKVQVTSVQKIWKLFAATLKEVAKG